MDLKEKLECAIIPWPLVGLFYFFKMWILSQKDIATILINLFILAAFHFIELFNSNYSFRFDCIAYAFTKKLVLIRQCFGTVKTKKKCYNIRYTEINTMVCPPFLIYFHQRSVFLILYVFVIYLFEKAFFLHLWEHHISVHNIVHRTKEKDKKRRWWVLAFFLF